MELYFVQFSKLPVTSFGHGKRNSDEYCFNKKNRMMKYVIYNQIFTATLGIPKINSLSF
jgi:hypothetical protein